MIYYVDCEFDGHRGRLLSIALVRKDGYGIHVQTLNKPFDKWVEENVMPHMNSHNAENSVVVDENSVGAVLRVFIGQDKEPAFISDSPVDTGRLCRALTTNEAGEWQPCGYDTMQFLVSNVDCYPTKLEGAVRHNAWWDAMALREIVHA